MSKGGNGNYSSETKRHVANYRASHPMGPGQQVQHWYKVIPALKSGMSTTKMNSNLSALQSRKGERATTMLVQADVEPGKRTPGKGTPGLGKGTRYTVHGVDEKGQATSKSFNTEHKFADAHLIPAEAAHIKAANPKVSPQRLVQAAGASARHKMTGHPGPVSKDVAEHVQMGKDKLPTERMAAETKRAAKFANAKAVFKEGQQATKGTGKSTAKGADKSSGKSAAKGNPAGRSHSAPAKAVSAPRATPTRGR